MVKAVRYPKFLAESINESIRQKYRDTRVNTRYMICQNLTQYRVSCVVKKPSRMTHDTLYMYVVKAGERRKQWRKELPDATISFLLKKFSSNLT